MKQTLLLFIIVLSGFGFSQSTIKIANKAFADEQYKIAIQNYLEAIANDQKSAELYYNLGNSYYKTNEIGEAIWAYQQALKIEPSNEDIIHNLQYVNNLTADKLVIETKGIGSWLSKNVFQFSTNFWFYLSIVSALLTALALYMFFTPTNTKVNNLSLFFGSLFGLILILSFTFSVMHKSRLINNTKAVIIHSNAKILTSPNAEASTSFELHEGAQLNLKNTQDQWYEVSLNKNTGWVNKNNVWVY